MKNGSFPREILDHQTNEVNAKITLRADERDPKNGNASHRYGIAVDTGTLKMIHDLRFQHGPVQEAGINGITNEVLLAIVADRLDGFQSGPYACEENAQALTHVRAALAALHARTQKRIERGVEGTHEL